MQNLGDMLRLIEAILLLVKLLLMSCVVGCKNIKEWKNGNLGMRGKARLDSYSCISLILRLPALSLSNHFACFSWLVRRLTSLMPSVKARLIRFGVNLRAKRACPSLQVTLPSCTTPNVNNSKSRLKCYRYNMPTWTNYASCKTASCNSVLEWSACLLCR